MNSIGSADAVYRAPRNISAVTGSDRMLFIVAGA